MTLISQPLRTWRIALCGAFNRFNDVLQLDIEDDAATAMENVA